MSCAAEPVIQFLTADEAENRTAVGAMGDAFLHEFTDQGLHLFGSEGHSGPNRTVAGDSGKDLPKEGRRVFGLRIEDLPDDLFCPCGIEEPRHLSDDHLARAKGFDGKSETGQVLSFFVHSGDGLGVGLNDNGKEEGLGRHGPFIEEPPFNAREKDRLMGRMLVDDEEP